MPRASFMSEEHNINMWRDRCKRLAYDYIDNSILVWVNGYPIDITVEGTSPNLIVTRYQIYDGDVIGIRMNKHTQLVPIDTIIQYLEMMPYNEYNATLSAWAYSRGWFNNSDDSTMQSHIDSDTVPHLAFVGTYDQFVHEFKNSALQDNALQDNALQGNVLDSNIEMQTNNDIKCYITEETNYTQLGVFIGMQNINEKPQLIIHPGYLSKYALNKGRVRFTRNKQIARDLVWFPITCNRNTRIIEASTRRIFGYPSDYAVTRDDIFKIVSCLCGGLVSAITSKTIQLEGETAYANINHITQTLVMLRRYINYFKLDEMLHCVLEMNMKDVPCIQDIYSMMGVIGLKFFTDHMKNRIFKEFMNRCAMQWVKHGITSPSADAHIMDIHGLIVAISLGVFRSNRKRGYCVSMKTKHMIMDVFSEILNTCTWENLYRRCSYWRLDEPSCAKDSAGSFADALEKSERLDNYRQAIEVANTTIDCNAVANTTIDCNADANTTIDAIADANTTIDCNADAKVYTKSTPEYMGYQNTYDNTYKQAASKGIRTAIECQCI